MNRLLLLASLVLPSLVAAAADAIRPGALWRDTAGHVINAHGGGVLFDRGIYWWYGEHKVYGTAGNRAHVGVHAYSSTDLVNWTDRGIALAVSDDPASDLADGCILERPKVLRCPKTGRYVMHFHLELKGQGYSAARVGIATSERPEGPFRFLRSLRPNGAMSRDQTLFVDEDGSAWQICASENNATTHLNRLTDDYTDFTGEFYTMGEGDHTEAAAVCRHGGWYFLVGSGCTGWQPNEARLYRAKALKGPWERLGNPCRGISAVTRLGPDLTWGAQSTFLLPVAGRPGEVIALFDVWNPRNHEESRYVWLPVAFEGDALAIDWRDSWRPTVAPLPTAPDVRFMTYNVYGDYGKLAPAKVRAEPLAAEIVTNRPHLVALQEISAGWYACDFFAHLATNGYALVRGDRRRGDEFYGLARAGAAWGDPKVAARKAKKANWCNHEPLLYDTRRFALLDSDVEFYHLNLQVEKSVTWAVLEDRFCGRRVLAFSTHFWWKYLSDESGQLRELNARRVLETVACVKGRWGEMPVLGGGDLNCRADAMPLLPFAAAGWRNAGLVADICEPHATCGTNVIDHVFFSAGDFDARRYAVDAHAGLEAVSDHYPVLVDFSYRP